MPQGKGTYGSKVGRPPKNSSKKTYKPKFASGGIMKAGGKTPGKNDTPSSQKKKTAEFNSYDEMVNSKRYQRAKNSKRYNKFTYWETTQDYPDSEPYKKVFTHEVNLDMKPNQKVPYFDNGGKVKDKKNKEKKQLPDIVIKYDEDGNRDMTEVQEEIRKKQIDAQKKQDAKEIKPINKGKLKPVEIPENKRDDDRSIPSGLTEKLKENKIKKQTEDKEGKFSLTGKSLPGADSVVNRISKSKKPKMDKGGKVSEALDKKDIKLPKIKIDTSAATDTNKPQEFLSNKDLNRKYNIVARENEKQRLADLESQRQYLDEPKHVRDFKSAALMNPISALYAAPAQAIQQKQKSKRDKKMKDGGQAPKYFLGGVMKKLAGKKRGGGSKGGGSRGASKGGMKGMMSKAMAAKKAGGMKGGPGGKSGMMGKMMAKGKGMGPGKGGMMQRPGGGKPGGGLFGGMKRPGGGMMGGRPGGAMGGRPGGMMGGKPGGGMFGGMKRPGGPGARPGGGGMLGGMKKPGGGGGIGGMMGGMKKPGMARYGAQVPDYGLGGWLKKAGKALGGAAKGMAGGALGMVGGLLGGKGGAGGGEGGGAGGGGGLAGKLGEMEARIASLESGGEGMAAAKPGGPNPADAEQAAQGLFGGAGAPASGTPPGVQDLFGSSWTPMMMSDKRAKKNIKKVGVMKGERGAVVPSVDKARGRSRGKLATSIKTASGNTGAGIKKKPVKKYSKGGDVKEKIKDVGIFGGKKAGMKGLGKGLKGVGSKTGSKFASKLGSRAVPGLGTALLAKDGYKFLDKHQVGQKSVKNIGKSSGRPFLGKMKGGGKISKGYMPDLTIISISAKKRKKKK